MDLSITIRGNNVRPLGIEHANAARTNYIYICCSQPLKDNQKEQLARLRVHVQLYVHPFTYICRYEPEDLDALRSLSFVEVVNCFHHHFKASPQLREILQSQPSADVDIGLHEGARSAASVVHSVEFASIQGIERESIEHAGRQIRAHINYDALPALVKIDDIQSVDFVPPCDFLNNMARGAMGFERATFGNIFSPFRGLRAANQTICIADSGFDKGDIMDKHPAFKNCRIELIAVGRTQSGLTNDPTGHGTHVAASAVGDGYSKGERSFFGIFRGRIQGTGIGAALIIQSMLNQSGSLSTPLDLGSRLFQYPYSRGARIHSNSWGPRWDAVHSPYKYNLACQQIDEFIFAHPDFTVVFAAGNDGHRQAQSHIGGVAAAKNAICVGASESGRPTSDGATYDPREKRPHDQRSVASFSSRGPTPEGRMKPDIVAPGVAIYSALSRDAASRFRASKDPLWTYMSGTSMATPLVAGCIALIREALLSPAGAPPIGQAPSPGYPSAALIKALLIHYATALTGTRTAFVSKNGTISAADVRYLPPPSVDYGYGKVNIHAVLNAITENSTGDRSGFRDNRQGLVRVGENKDEIIRSSWSDTDDTPRPPPRVKATLVWSDPAGEYIQNYLELSIRSKGGVDRPYVGGSASGGFENNVQQVEWEQYPDDSATIVVCSQRITKGPQPYAIVWSCESN